MLSCCAQLALFGYGGCAQRLPTKPAPTNETSAYQPNQHAMNSWDDADLLIDISHLRRSARHQLQKTAGNTNRPNSTNVGTVQGKRPHSASVGAAPSATQAQKVRRKEQRRPPCQAAHNGDCPRAKPFGGLVGGRAIFQDRPQDLGRHRMLRPRVSHGCVR